jgi:hypothetical protein
VYKLARQAVGGKESKKKFPQTYDEQVAEKKNPEPEPILGQGNASSGDRRKHTRPLFGMQKRQRGKGGHVEDDLLAGVL